MPLIRAFIRGSLDAGQPLPRFASGVPCHAPTLPHRETVCAKTFTAQLRRARHLSAPIELYHILGLLRYFTLQFSGMGIPVSQSFEYNRGPPTPSCTRRCCGGGEIITAAVVLLSVKLTASARILACAYKVRIMRVLCVGVRV